MCRRCEEDKRKEKKHHSNKGGCDDKCKTKLPKCCNGVQCKGSPIVDCIVQNHCQCAGLLRDALSSTEKWMRCVYCTWKTNNCFDSCNKKVNKCACNSCSNKCGSNKCCGNKCGNKKCCNKKCGC